MLLVFMHYLLFTTIFIHCTAVNRPKKCRQSKGVIFPNPIPTSSLVWECSQAKTDRKLSWEIQGKRRHKTRQTFQGMGKRIIMVLSCQKEWIIMNEIREGWVTLIPRSKSKGWMMQRWKGSCWLGGICFFIILIPLIQYTIMLMQLD